MATKGLLTIKYYDNNHNMHLCANLPNGLKLVTLHTGQDLSIVIDDLFKMVYDYYKFFPDTVVDQEHLERLNAFEKFFFAESVAAMIIAARPLMWEPLGPENEPRFCSYNYLLQIDPSTGTWRFFSSHWKKGRLINVCRKLVSYDKKL